MIKKLFVIILILMDITLQISAADKASNNFAKKAKSIYIEAEGYDSKNKNNNDYFGICISKYSNYEWVITIVSDNETILSGTFILDSNQKDYSSWLKLHGNNNITGENLNVLVDSTNNYTYITFSRPKGEGMVEMPYDSFTVSKYDSKTSVYFCEKPTYLYVQELKIGTPKQFKMWLSENPNIK